MEVGDYLDNVDSLKSFLEFVELLSSDFERDGEAWQNSSPDMYLESLQAVLPHLYDDLSIVAKKSLLAEHWHFFARALFAARNYE